MTPTSQWVFQRVKVVTQNWLQTKKQEALNYQASHFINECGRWDLNPHGIATTRSLVLLVCQFRHFRIAIQNNNHLASHKNDNNIFPRQCQHDFKICRNFLYI